MREGARSKKNQSVRRLMPPKDFCVAKFRPIACGRQRHREAVTSPSPFRVALTAVPRSDGTPLVPVAFAPRDCRSRQVLPSSMKAILSARRILERAMRDHHAGGGMSTSKPHCRLRQSHLVPIVVLPCARLRRRRRPRLRSRQAARIGGRAHTLRGLSLVQPRHEPARQPGHLARISHQAACRRQKALGFH